MEKRNGCGVLYFPSNLLFFFGEALLQALALLGGGALSAVPLGVDCGLVVSTDLPTVQNLELTTVNPDYYQIPFLLNKHHMNVSSSKSKQWVVFEL